MLLLLLLWVRTKLRIDMRLDELRLLVMLGWVVIMIMVCGS